jgi:hypothetical protein
MGYVQYSIDGNQVCATYSHFKCLSVDKAGFGDSLKEAFFDLVKDDFSKDRPGVNGVRPWEQVWLLEIERNRSM